MASVDCLHKRHSKNQCTPFQESPSRFVKLYKLLLKTILPKATSIPTNPHTILVTTSGNLGGSVISTTLIKSLRAFYPQTHLCVVTNSEVGKELIERFGLADSCFTIKGNAHTSFSGIFSCISTLRKISKLKPEIIFDNFNSDIGKFLLPLRIPVRISHTGLSPSKKTSYLDSLSNFPVPISNVKNWHHTFGCLAAVVQAPFDSVPRLDLPAEEIKLAYETLQKKGSTSTEKRIVFQIGVWRPQSWKQWPLTKLAQLGKHLWERHAIRPVCVGSGKDWFEELQSYAPETPFIDVVSETSVTQSAAMTRTAILTVCNDSGLLHLAAAVGSTVLGLYGMTDPDITWNYPKPSEYIRRADCTPCYHQARELLDLCPHKGCLSELSLEAVIKKVEDMCHLSGDTPPSHQKEETTA